MNKDEAISVVSRHLKSLPISDPTDEYIIVSDLTLERSYGWIFRFSSKLYVETGNFIYALGGNGPIVVLRDTGEVIQLSPAVSGDEAVKIFEEKMGGAA